MSEAFPKTYWTMIQRAGDTALNRIASDYAAPVRRFVQRAGFSPEDAADLAQEVCLIVCDAKFLEQADQQKGKFRTLVLLVAKNVMNGEWRRRYAKKRKGKALSLDGATIADMLAAPPPSDESFDREWWGGLLECALGSLKEENPRRHQILDFHKNQGRSHAEIAEELSTSSDHINNEVRAGKKRLREILLERVRGYCSTTGEYEEEIQRFKRMLG